MSIELLKRRRMMMQSHSVVTLSVEVTMGKYVHSAGIIGGTAASFMTTTLPVHTGQVVKISCYGGAVTAVIFSGDNAPYTVRVVGAGSANYRTYTWTATEDCNVGFSGTPKAANDPVVTIDGVNVELIGY